MKLNPDCVRDVLLAVESCNYGQHMSLAELEEKLSSYPENEIQYTCLKLQEGGYLDVLIAPSMSACPHVVSIGSMTFRGHEFLAQIHDEKQWSKVKHGLSAVRSFSLSAISAIAEGVSSAAISKYLFHLSNP